MIAVLSIETKSLLSF